MKFQSCYQRHFNMNFQRSEEIMVIKEKKQKNRRKQNMKVDVMDWNFCLVNYHAIIFIIIEHVNFSHSC